MNIYAYEYARDGQKKNEYKKTFYNFSSISNLMKKRGWRREEREKEKKKGKESKKVRNRTRV